MLDASETNPSLPASRAPAALGRVATALVAMALFALICFAATRLSLANERIPLDQNVYHLPTILKFARELPRPDLVHYGVSSTPGYHLLMAVVVRVAGDDVGMLRVVGSAFGLMLVGLLGWFVGRSWRVAHALLLCLPVATSLYVISSSGWLLPENAAWLLVLASLAVCLLNAPSAVTLALWSMLAALLVFTRQSQAWIALPMAAWVLHAWWPRWRHALGAIVLAALPMVLVAVTFIVLWHGLVPPMFQPDITRPPMPRALAPGGFAPGAVMMTLAILGLFGPLLLPRFWPAEVAARRRTTRLLLLGLAAGFIVALMSDSSYLVHERRTGIFNIAQRLSLLAETKTGFALERFDRSLPMMFLTSAGGAVAAVALGSLQARDRWILAAALVGFAAAQMTTVLLWQRYYEPFVLLWLTLAAARSTLHVESPLQRRLIVLGSILLIVMQLTVSWVALSSVTSPSPQ